MIIKKFVGKTENDAVEIARKELGEGIVIMNVKEAKKKGIFAVFKPKLVEVTVALEAENVQPVAKAAGAAQRAGTEAGDGKQSTRSTGSLIAQNANTESIERKLDSLQTLLENQLKKAEEEKVTAKESAAESGTETKEGDTASEKGEDGAKDSAENKSENPEKEKFLRLLYNTMLDNEVDEKYANQILDEVDKNKKVNMPFDYILANTYQKMILKFGKASGISPAAKGPKVVLFIGPTGVGKTTTIAKIASKFSMDEKKKVALLTSDTYRIAAAEQLRTYANILEVPFRVIYTEDELASAVSDFSEFDYIFVDTTGHSHQNNEQIDKLQKMINILKDKTEFQCFLVVSAVTKYKDLLKIAETYSTVTEYQLIFTKLDETNSLGNLLNVKLQTETPIAYITCGQNVPDDIEAFNPQKTVKLLLGGK